MARLVGQPSMLFSIHGSLQSISGRLLNIIAAESVLLDPGPPLPGIAIPAAAVDAHIYLSLYV
jgi:hypothetical protein